MHGNDTLKEPTEKPPEYEKVWSIIPEKGFGEVLKIVYEESEFELYWKNRYLYFKHKVKEMSVMIIHLIEKIVRGGVENNQIMWCLYTKYINSGYLFYTEGMYDFGIREVTV